MVALVSVQATSNVLLLSPRCYSPRRVIGTEERQFQPQLAANTKAHVNPRRCVSFKVDEKGEVATDIVTFEGFPRELYPNLYYSRREKKEIMSQAQLDCQAYVLHHPDVVEKLERFSSNTNRTLKGSIDEMAIFMCCWVSFGNRTTTRGLETGCCTAIRKNRRQFTQQLLDRYNRLVSTEMPRVQIEEQLQQYSHNRSRRSREFAFMIGVADTLAAGRDKA